MHKIRVVNATLNMFFREMTPALKPAKKSSEKKIKPSIKKEPIHPSDYMKYNLPLACENCSHFSSPTETCTLGYMTAPHLKRNQEKSYSLSGKIAFCRFIEID